MPEPASTGQTSRGLAHAIIRHRLWIVLAWIAITAALFLFAGRAEKELEATARIDGSESMAVTDMLKTRFGSPFAESVILVVLGTPSPTSEPGLAALRRITRDLSAVRGVRGVLSYVQAPDRLFVGSNGAGTFVLVGIDRGGESPDAMMTRLRAASAKLAARLRGSFAAVTLRWTGEAALNADLRRASAKEAQSGELRVLPVVLVLLLLAFGTVAAAGLPLLIGVLAIPIALGLAVIVAQYWPMSVILVNVVTMVGLGLSIDYALLTVSRFREAYAREPNAVRAAAEAARHAGRTIALSGMAVAIGFAAMLTVPLSELRSLAVGGLLVVAVSVLLATTLLPGLLAWIGPRIDFGRLPFLRRRRSHEAWWRAWGNWVAARPLRVLVLAGAPLLLLAAQALRLNIELPRGNWLPGSAPSVKAAHDLAKMGRSGVVQTIRVVLELPEGIVVGQDKGWAAIDRLSAALGKDPRVARVRSVTTLVGAKVGPAAIALIPEAVRRTLVGDVGRIALIEVIPREGAEPSALVALVRALRRARTVDLTGLRGAQVRIGGLPAFNADYEDAVGGRFLGVVGLVLLATFLALAVGFRCLLVPLKAVALNVLSVAAALGAVVLVFQDGFGAGLLGLAGPVGSVFPIVPILVFCIVFGLSLDYEVFLVARIAEARRAGMDEREALAEGLARSGGVITSAAAIMIAVFVGFIVGDFLLIKMLGFALAVAVLLDATLVRLAVGPALIKLAGRWNWWPGGA